ncbi:MAG: tetratricopeptide repeat protein [Vicinamibacterales bacterium]
MGGVTVLAVLLAAALGRRWMSSDDTRPPPVPQPASVQAAFVGSGACAECHREQRDRWRESQHAAAMALATPKTVLARFDDRVVTNGGIKSRFFRQSDKFLLQTDGPDGRLATFEVGHTFGLSPLQQYLIALPGGRLQALGLAWDTRPVSLGGQRWFPMYPPPVPKAGDPVHWTGFQQNWNFMCADCHSTNVRKGYSAATHQFQTQSTEMGVGCEACHGPGSAHVAAARAPSTGPSTQAANGLTVRLNERSDITWTFDGATGVPVRSRPLTSEREIEVCARCHARRSQLTDNAKAGDRLDDGFRISLLEPGLYHPDGQQFDEVYTYGSFLQSKMYAKGVTCSDCHEPHTAAIRMKDNAICTRCHAGAAFEAPVHSRHAAGTPGSLCVSCHMPTKVYMQIDARHDHSFRIPRPDRSVTLGVPNACTAACHANKTAAWAAASLASRAPRAGGGFQSFAETFATADRGDPAAVPGLVGVLRDPMQSAIARASAADRLARLGWAADPSSIGPALRDPSPLVRRATLQILAQADVSLRLELVPALLTDPIRTVRTEAALALVDLPDDRLSGSFRAAFEEYLAELRFNADRPEAQSSLGTALAARGRLADAATAFREAIAIDRTFVPAIVNLADTLRRSGDDQAAATTLREAIALNPRAAALHHALGLALVRQNRGDDGLAELAAATRLDPRAPRFAYVYAVALHDTGRPAEAMTLLTKTLAAFPYDRDTLLTLATYAADAGQIDEATTLAKRLLAGNASDPEAQALWERLRSSRRPS